MNFILVVWTGSNYVEASYHSEAYKIVVFNST